MEATAASQEECPITEDDYQEVGSFIEMVMLSPQFNKAWEEWERTTSHQMLSTKPDEPAEREAVYRKFEGSTMFLTFLKSIVEGARAISQQRSIQELAEPSDEELQDWYADEQDTAITADDYR